MARTISGKAITAQATAAQSVAPVPAQPGPSSRSQALVRQAGQFTAGALGMVTVAVVLHVGRTLRGLVRR